MSIKFPSPEFDAAVAAVCDGAMSEEQARELNELLRHNPAARDEYIFRVELHSRLASKQELFAPELTLLQKPLGEAEARVDGARSSASFNRGHATRHRSLMRPVLLALAACLAVAAAGWWLLRPTPPAPRQIVTNQGVALLNQVVNAQWEPHEEAPRLGAPVEPGVLQLKSGLAQIVFYSGVRVAIEGPAELELISPSEAFLRRGRLIAEIPAQAAGFRVRTGQMHVTDQRAVFGLQVTAESSELHVFNGTVEVQALGRSMATNLVEGAAAIVEGSNPARFSTAVRALFSSLFNLQEMSSVAETMRYEQWREASAQLNHDPSLLVHFDFNDRSGASTWHLPNVSRRRDLAMDATIVGGQWVEGRWPGKGALEFRGMGDRVRFSVPGEYDGLTLACWVRVQGLDRRVNSLFMSDGFDPGTLHWLILNDGAPTVTIVGGRSSDLQIDSAPRLLTVDKFGMWHHLAIVVDSRNGQVVHYLNGTAVKETPLKIKAPFRIGGAELGNWNAKGFKGDESLMIRNFSGAMDQFCLFGRALMEEEIRDLYTQGKPQPEAENSR